MFHLVKIVNKNPVFVNYNCHYDNKTCQNNYYYLTHLSNIGQTTTYTKDNMQMFIKKNIKSIIF
ncbi:hypothetical protein BACI71_110552 [Bacillus mycoides]|uniref:Uncharacterized protein n=1 Tax=Bacillus mycoides TaxID=1405 RepID=A0A653QYL7_BACMY|nr:hypothetical protein BACI71_110552 [Bacillus mycoides]